MQSILRPIIRSTTIHDRFRRDASRPCEKLATVVGLTIKLTTLATVDVLGRYFVEVQSFGQNFRGKYANSLVTRRASRG